MSKSSFYICLFILPTALLAQIDKHAVIIAWQSALNESFKDETSTPLDKKEWRKFKSLDFYPIDTTYHTEALFIRTPNKPPFTIPTTTERKPVYQQYGLAVFTILGKTDTLHLYESMQMSLDITEEKHLFVPFTDLTCGTTSYGGGRYLDVDYPANDTTIIIDFNKAYNPYCAYSSLYSCPIPPRENDLALEIKAGVKDWKKGKH